MCQLLDVKVVSVKFFWNLFTHFLCKHHPYNSTLLDGPLSFFFLTWCYTIHIVLDKTLKGIQVVLDSITKRFFRAPGLRTKHFESFYLSFNIIYTTKAINIKWFQKNSAISVVLNKIIFTNSYMIFVVFLRLWFHLFKFIYQSNWSFLSVKF